MTYQFAPPTTAATEMDWQITANAWRGSCLEVFSRAERSIDDCIAKLERSGFDLGALAHHRDTAARARTLKEFLERTDAVEHPKACVRMLEKWIILLGERALVAHGAMAISRDSVSLRLREHGGSDGSTEREQSFTRIQMLSLLNRLGSDQGQLQQQLSRIEP